MNRPSRKTVLVISLIAVLALIPARAVAPAAFPTPLDLLNAIRDVEHKLWSNADSVKNETKDVEGKLWSNADSVKNETKAVQAALADKLILVSDSAEITSGLDANDLIRINITSDRAFQLKAIYVKQDSGADLGSVTCEPILDSEGVFAAQGQMSRVGADFDFEILSRIRAPAVVDGTQFDQYSMHLYPALPADGIYQCVSVVHASGGTLTVIAVLETAQDASFSVDLTNEGPL